MRRIGGLALALSAWLGFFAPAEAEAQVRRPRVAVLELQDAAPQSYQWKNQGTTGQAVTDMLVSELTRVGRFSVVERTQLDALLREHQLDMAGILDSQTAAEAGRILGIDAVVLGSITQAGLAQKKLGVGKASITRLQAEVWLDVRLVSTKTAEVVIAVTEKGGESAHSGRAPTQKGTVTYDDTSDQTLIGEAAREAVRRVAKSFAKKAGQIEMVSPMMWEAELVLDGERVFSQDGFVYINAGFIKGVQPGERLEIQRINEALSVPIPKVLGMLEVVDSSVSDGSVSKCRVLAGNIEELEPRDIVRRANVIVAQESP